MTLTFVSTFAGCGGIDLAFENAGWESVLQIEIEPNCNSVRRHHWPDCVHLEDIRDVETEDVCGFDAIFGGVPCQDWSVAGRRAGLAGERSGLFWEFHRLIDGCRPRWILFENVPGLLSSDEGRCFGTVLGSLAELGYGLAYRILDAQFFGVPQRRRRVFVVGYLGNVRRAAEVLFEPESLPWDPPPSREERTHVARTLTSGVAASSGVNPPGRRREDDENLVAATINSGGNSGGFRTEPGEHLVAYQCHGSDVGKMGTIRASSSGIPFIAHTLKAEGHDASEDGTGRGVPIVIAADIRPCGFCGYEFDHETLGKYGCPNCNGEGLSIPKVTTCIQERDGKGQDSDCTKPLIPHTNHGVRRLTPRELERLQGMPDDWTRWGHDGREISDSARGRMIGNSVAVPVVEWIARRMIEAD